MKPILPYLDYAINFNYISTELCENKDKPELDCKGKCHLKKEIRKVVKTEQNQILPDFGKVVEDYYVPESTCINYFDYISNGLFIMEDEKLLKAIPLTIFTPPKV